MAFHPSVGDTFHIRGTDYTVTEHPAAPGIPYGQQGRQGTVYQLAPVSAAESQVAIKVLNPNFRMPAMVRQSKQLEPYVQLRGLSVCERYVLTPEEDATLLNEYEDLLYSVVMPWVEGPTWADVLAEQRALSKLDSYQAASSLLQVLSGMEQSELAHCDLSAPNVLLPGMVAAQVPVQADDPYVALVDLEQMYGPGIDQPKVLTSGSPGYAAHRAAPNGMWGPEADRFAGAVLVAEMLTWFHAGIREQAWGESYFDPSELQQPSERYDYMMRVLTEYWGADITDLFRRAWESEKLSQCPTFGEWLLKISKLPAPSPEETAQVGDASQPDAPTDKAAAPVEELDYLSQLERGTALETAGNIAEAVQVYRSALVHVPPGHENLAQELQFLIERLSAQVERNDALPAVPPVPAEPAAAEAFTQAPLQQASQADRAESPAGKRDDGGKANKKPRTRRMAVPIVAGVVVVAGVGGYFAYRGLTGTATPPVKQTAAATPPANASNNQTTSSATGAQSSLSLWTVPYFASNGNWNSDPSSQKISLTAGENNQYVSIDVHNFADATLTGTISPKDGIPFQLAFYVDSRLMYTTPVLKSGGTVPVQIPVKNASLLTIKLINNSVHGDTNQESSFDLNNMVVAGMTVANAPDTKQAKSLWTWNTFASVQNWNTDTNNHDVGIQHGENNDYIMYDFGPLHVGKSTLSGVIVPSTGIPFKLKFTEDNFAYTTPEVDPAKDVPEPFTIPFSGRFLTVQVLNNSVHGDDNQKSYFAIRNMLLNVTEPTTVPDLQQQQSLWTASTVTSNGNWSTDSNNLDIDVQQGQNGDLTTYDISQTQSGSWKMTGVVVPSEGIPYKLEFDVDGHAVFTTPKMTPGTTVPLPFNVAVKGSKLTIKVLNDSVSGDSNRTSTLSVRDLIIGQQP